jgi:hypothetical protein
MHWSPHTSRPPPGSPSPLRPEPSAGILRHVMLRGIEGRSLANGHSPQAIYTAAHRGRQAAARWRAIWKKLM